MPSLDAKESHLSLCIADTLGYRSHVFGFPELAGDKSHQVFISLSTVAVIAEKTTYFNGSSNVDNIVSK